MKNKIKQFLNKTIITINYSLYLIDWFSVAFYGCALLLMTFIFYTFYIK